MEHCIRERKLLAEEFKKCQKTIIAIGDETRQRIILTLLEHEAGGMRVGEITERTHLSRPAVSHHLQILKEARIVGMRRKGTMNFYYMNAKDTEWSSLAGLLNHISEVIQYVADTGCPDCDADVE